MVDYDKKEKIIKISSKELKEQILKNILELKESYDTRSKVSESYGIKCMDTLYKVEQINKIDSKLTKDCLEACRSAFITFFPEINQIAGEKMIIEKKPMIDVFKSTPSKHTYLAWSFVNTLDCIIFKDCEDFKATQWWHCIKRKGESLTGLY